MDLLTKQHVAMVLEMTSAKEGLRAMVEALLGREAPEVPESSEPKDSSSLETVVPKKPRAKKTNSKVVNLESMC
jgi:hypothetical protein